MRTKSFIPLTRSSFLMLLLSLGTASAGDTTDFDPVGVPAAAPCNFMECTHEIQRCGSVCGWLFNGTVRSLNLAPRIDNLLVDIALAKQPDIQGALKEPPRSKYAANGNVRISYMTTAAEGTEPSGSETIKPSAETPETHWSHLPIWGAEAETVGGGVTLAGGFKVTDWRDLLAFMIGDVNHTVTFLSFKNESLIAHTKPHATVASSRVGLRGEVTKFISAGMWVGAMYQLIQEEVAGSVAGRSIEFIINQRAASPWNTLVGGQIDFGRHFNVFVEGGFGPRSSILTAGVFRF